jgi:N-acylneuraminate cytidylyltransferase
VPNKNIKPLRGHPMLAYTIRAAIDSGVFAAVVCSTDSEQYAEVARHYGAEVPLLRPADISGDKSPDIEWVLWTFSTLKQQGRSYDAFSILRPTNPFRLPATIVRAWETFVGDPHADSLRAIEKGKRILPVMPFANGDTPWHSSQYAALPEIYVQNASLEIAWSRVALETKSIAGEAIVPFVSQGLEGFDINDPEDWLLAEHYLSTGEGRLPVIGQSPYPIPE